LRATPCSLLKYIVTEVKKDDETKHYLRRMRNQMNPPEAVVLPGLLEPMSDKTWRTFVKKRREILFGKEGTDEAPHS
jgi:hypothetical protein